jgi:ketosteroid isomerase-like protein
MKRRIASGVVALLLAAAGHATDAPDRTLGESAKGIFEKIEKDWANALVNADRAGLDRYEAPEYTLVTATGATLTKAQSDGELLNGNQHFDALEISGIEVYRSGNLAVVTGHARSREKYRGQDNSGDYEFIDVFARRHGRWLAVRAQLTRIAPTDR